MFLYDENGPFAFKAPADVTPYGVRWAGWLASVGEPPLSFTWTVPSPLVKAGEALMPNNVAAVYLGGGTVGAVVTVTCTCVTATREKSWSFRVRVVTQVPVRPV